MDLKKTMKRLEADVPAKLLFFEEGFVKYSVQIAKLSPRVPKAMKKYARDLDQQMKALVDRERRLGKEIKEVRQLANQVNETLQCGPLKKSLVRSHSL